MAGKGTVGVRYCGGCNPRYDRVALLRQLEMLLPELDFVPATAGVSYDAVIAVCGCEARCAGVEHFSAGQILYLTGPAWLAAVHADLKQVQRCTSATFVADLQR